MFSKKVGGKKHPWELCYCRDFSIIIYMILNNIVEYPAMSLVSFTARPFYANGIVITRRILPAPLFLYTNLRFGIVFLARKYIGIGMKI